ncbi:hypothetical protein B9Z55_004356 [Caenorhabditis nigoni]|uniref:DUF7809 domain-containing protein n=2 Tax=Caenorhabditis nigoni TaxID=1611254 RepID=A0A2G5UW57_9PELO|nr:hypothetical protein B9Z55_004356 [Caenorhabditis nigoni]
MSRFLDIPSFVRHPASLHRESQLYALPGVYPQVFTDAVFESEYPKGPLDGKDVEFIQFLMDKVYPKLRMYGSAEELLENINIFKDFPGSQEFFGTTDDPYQTRPRIFKSFKNEKYMAKSDLFVILQNMIFHLPPEFHKNCALTAVIYLKSKQGSIEKCAEFVKFDEERFEGIFKKLEEQVRKIREEQFQPTQLEQLTVEFSGLSNLEIHQKFQKLIPFELDDNQDDYLSVILGKCIDFSQKALFFSRCKPLINSLDTIIYENLEMFLPRGEDSEEPITVRIFRDGDQQYLMKSEIFKIKPDEASGFMDTITMEELFRKHESHTKNVEFIRYPITRAKHRVTPVQGPFGKFYLLAVDVFFDEMLRDLIQGLRVFQKYTVEEFSRFSLTIHEIEQYFYATENPYFIQSDKTLWVKYGEMSDRPAKEVRNVEPSGFTVQDLKNELAHLGLTTTFPEIQEYAEKVYSEVDKRKKESVLRACDMYDAVEQCQVNCILKRFPYATMVNDPENTSGKW